PPGSVANRDQLSSLADVGVVLLLFEVGIEINPLRLAREGRRLLLLAPLQVAVTWILSAAACVALGMSIAGAAMIGLSIAMSSSVVVVNITRSRRRTTDRITDDELLGWSVIQDLVGVSAALVLVVVLGIGGRSGLAAIGGGVAFVALAAGAGFVLPWLLHRLQAEQHLLLLGSGAAGGRGARPGWWRPRCARRARPRGAADPSSGGLRTRRRRGREHRGLVDPGSHRASIESARAGGCSMSLVGPPDED